MFAQGLVMKRAGIGSVGVVSLAALVLMPAPGGAQEEATAEMMTELSEEAPTSTAGNERSAAFDGGTGLFSMPVANGVDAGIFLLSAALSGSRINPARADPWVREVAPRRGCSHALSALGEQGCVAHARRKCLGNRSY
jgi:hypothetical protein